MRLRRSVLAKPGITRRRRGEGFAYYGPGGDLLCDEHTLQRIQGPGHSASVEKGVGSARTRTGTFRLSGPTLLGAASTCITKLGNRIAPRRSSTGSWSFPNSCRHGAARSRTALAGRDFTRERVLALALYLLDRGYFRAGSEQYAEENESYGVATLLCEHVTVRRGTVNFDYPAKSGVRRTLVVEDPEVVRAVRSLSGRTERTERLLVCRTASGWADIRAEDLNMKVQGAGRRRLYGQGPADLAWHRAGCCSICRRRSSRVAASDQTG